MDKINILMVDDQPSRLLTYSTILEGLGENLIQVHSGDEALECLMKTDIAIVLTDVNMPSLDGFQLADMIHQHPRFEKTAIIFISGARMTDADRLRGYEHGAVDYISVPIVPELLRAKVRVFADLYRKARELETLYAEMRRLSGRMITALDEERRRIAREMHDGLGQELSSAKMIVDAIKADEAKEQAAEAGKVIDKALQQMRSICYLLHPPLLDELGLESAVRWYLEGLSKRSGIETSIEMDPDVFPRLLPNLETAVYRIIQEALTNAFRHSGARKVCVTLKQDEERMSVSIRDDGKGVPEYIEELRPGRVGVGVGGMIQRVKEFGGELRLLNANPGTLVEVVIPNKSVELDRSALATGSTDLNYSMRVS